MHEFSIASGIVEAACQEGRLASASHVRSVTCRVGILRQVDPELMRTAFELAAQDTLCEGATLELRQMPVHLACPGCGHQFDAYGWDWCCPRCHEDATCLEGGDELEVTTLEVEMPEETTMAKGGVR